MEKLKYSAVRRTTWLAGAAALALALGGLAPMIDVEHARADASVSGVVNTYQAVAAVSGDVVTVSGALAGAGAPFAVGDRVMLIQMTGVAPVVPGSNMGNYDNATITGIAGNQITLSGITRTYSPATEAVQLVRAIHDPGTVTIAGTVTAKTWDGVTGGVIAISGGSLLLDADIDASETGFTNVHPPTTAAQASMSFGSGDVIGRGYDGEPHPRETTSLVGVGGGGLGGGGGIGGGGEVGAPVPHGSGGGYGGGGGRAWSFSDVSGAPTAGTDGGAAALFANGYRSSKSAAGGGGGVLGGGGGGASASGGGGGGTDGGGSGGEQRFSFAGAGGGGPRGVGNGGDGVIGGPTGNSPSDSTNEGSAGGGGGSYGGGGGTATNPSGGDDASGGGGGGSWTGGGAGGSGGLDIAFPLPNGGDGNAPVTTPLPDSAHYLNTANPRLMMGGAGGRGSQDSGHSAGGTGGGIVLLDFVSIGGEGTIRADGGEGATPAGGGAHSGSGGGAGGQMRIRAEQLSDPLTAAANGGVGGTPTANLFHGGVSGGGGGAGGIWVELVGAAPECPADGTPELIFELAGGSGGPSITNPKNGFPTGTGGAGGDGLGCVTPFTPEPREPDLVYEKSSDPAPGSMVQPGDVIAYTVTVDNDTDVDSVAGLVTDDMSSVLDRAVLTGSPVLSCEPSGHACGSVSYTAGATSFEWSSSEVVPLQARTRATITYEVTVDDDATGTLGNVLVEPGLEIEHPILAHAKVSDPATGTQVSPGDQVTYTITVENTGSVDSSPFTVFDDLAGVLDQATLDVSSIAVSPNVGTAVYDEDEKRLSWSGALAAGQSVDVSYMVTVDADAFGALRNHFLDAETEHPVSASLAWHKIDPQGALLAGSEWALQALDGGGDPEGAVIDVIDCVAAPCTGVDTDPTPGQFLLAGLAPGVFALTETRAPVGYVLDDTVRAVTVLGTQQITMLDDIENAPQEVPELPMTGGMGTDSFLIAGAAAGVLVVGLVVWQVLWRRRAP